jgi:tRNA dimethylallyltransferase
MQNTLVIIAGPTAIGKTDLTIELAKHFRTEIISSDSRQIFKELTIGTAVPETHQLQAVTHHFIQHKSIFDNYNASAYEHDALQLIEKLFENHKTIFMTGGSGMYIEAVCSGIDDMPDISTEIRNKATQLLEKEGKEALQKILKEVDPDYFFETDINNPARLIRGVEMYWQTGKPFSLFRKQSKRSRNFNIIRIALDMPRDELHERINRRVDIMVESGLIEEAKLMFPNKGLVPLKTVGYQELFEYFEGSISLQEAIELIKRNTRRYARKQLSWFRRNKETTWFHPSQVKEIKSFISEKIENA